jgi:hypothetical protein
MDRPGADDGDAATSCVERPGDQGDGRQGADADEVHIVEIECESVHLHGIDDPEEPVELLDGVEVEVTGEDHERHWGNHVQFHQKRRLVGAGQAWLVHDDDDLRDGSQNTTVRGVKADSLTVHGAYRETSPPCGARAEAWASGNRPVRSGP